MTETTAGFQLVTLAAYLIGAAERRVETEDVAVKAHELAPGRFSWAKYPNQINLELVRVYLSDAKKSSKGALLTGSGASGWSLTRAGLAWAKSAVESGLNPSEGRSISGLRSPSLTRVRREQERLCGTAAWAVWRQGNSEISRTEAEAVFRIDSYADTDMRETKVSRLLALFSEEPEIHAFLQAAAQALGA